MMRFTDKLRLPAYVGMLLFAACNGSPERPEDISTLEDRIAYGKKLLYEGQSKAAAVQFDSAVSENSISGEAHLQRTVAYSALCNRRDSSYYCEQVTQVAREAEAADLSEEARMRIQLHKGAAEAQLGRHRSAVAAFDEVLKTEPDFRLAIEKRAYSRLMIQDTIGACHDYAQAVILGNKNPPYRDWVIYCRDNIEGFEPDEDVYDLLE